MQPEPVNGVPYVDTNSGGLGGGGKSLADDFDNFLLLLTEQLKHQDPLSPMDTNQYTEQIVQFTSVEQALLTNEKLDSLISLQSGDQLNAMVSYISKTVAVDSIAIELGEDGATITYGLAQNAETSEIRIIDENGSVIRTLPAETTAGEHEIVWDGKNDAGVEMDEGIYGILAVAKDADGESIATIQGTIGRVTGVEVENNSVVLSLGDLKVPLSQVISIRESPDSAG